jgi:Flp pilus assembly secretin CpaC
MVTMRVFPPTALFVVAGLVAVSSVAGAEGTAQPERGDPFTVPVVPIPDPQQPGAAAPPQRLPVMEMTVGDMELIRLPQPAGTIISLVPGVVTVGTQEPGMLFIFAETPGETKIVVADEAYNEMFASTIKVSEPGL